MKISIITLGCPKNVVDSEHLSAELVDNRVQFTDRADQADVVIINTCAFILPAREEAIETILEAVELKAQGKVKRVYVTGCLPQRYIDELKNEIPEVDGLFDKKDFRTIGKELANELKLEPSIKTKRHLLHSPGHYAYLKISDGCDNRCRYCTIPIIKGRNVSRSSQELIEEAAQLVHDGVRELILVAQDTTYYGWDRGEKDGLKNLIRELVKIEDLRWLRLLYAHPVHFDAELISLFTEEEKLCRYIDLPVQHISDRILKAMGRPIGEHEIRRLIEKLRTSVPDMAIRTTLMVGYPGESEQDFQLLKEFVAQVEFERLGVFKFIPEEGTPAANMADQIDESIKEDRLEEIMELQYGIAEKKNRKLLGETVTVLIDEWQEENGYSLGRTQWDSPQIDNLVHVKGKKKVGSFVEVTIARVEEYDLWGEAK